MDTSLAGIRYERVISQSVGCFDHVVSSDIHVGLPLL